MTAICDALDDIGAEIVDIVVVIKKAGDSEFDESDHEATSLVEISVEDGDVTIH
jgi:adenine phosphoribosyltransferase